MANSDTQSNTTYPGGELWLKNKVQKRAESKNTQQPNSIPQPQSTRNKHNTAI